MERCVFCFFELQQTDKPIYGEYNAEAKEINDPKIPMLCFVTENHHTEQSSDSTPEKSESEKHRLFYAPFAVLCLGFVNSV